MKVLWFSVTPLSLDSVLNTGIEGKGWISSLLQLALQCEELELVVAYENYSPEKKPVEQGERLKIIPINISRYGKRQILKDMMTFKEVDDYIIGESLRIVEEHQPDLIHVFGAEWCFGLLAGHVSIPVVIHIQGLWSQIRNCMLLPGQSVLGDRLQMKLLCHPLGLFARYHYYNLSKERHKREENILRNNHYFMCRTRWDQAIVKFYNKQAKIFHVDEALRPAFLEEGHQWMPRRQNNKIIISTTGACYSIKGPDVALKTARLLLENTDYEVEWKWIGGTDEDMSEYEKLTGIKSGDVGIKMMGNLSAQQMIDELLASDMYVHMSYADNSPNAVCEAQCLGLPVIAADTGGVPSLFSENYDRNMFVPINDPFYLAAKIVELREDSQKAAFLSGENRTIAMNRHHSQRIMEQLMNSYHQIICGV